MRHATCPQFVRIAKTTSLTACCFALVLASVANAQSLDSQMQSLTPEPYSQGMDGGAVAQRPSQRSIFVGTIAALIAQGLGNGVGSALSQGLGGSIARWFTREPSPGAMGADQAMATHAVATPMQSDREPPAGLHAGVAYEVHLIGRDGTPRAVDPARHAFRTGDRFQVHYRPALPGRIDVSNIDPHGGESRIDSIEVAAGQLAALGPYQFVDLKGRETLKLVLSPCSSPLLTAATRGIVKVGAAAADAAVRISDCGEAATGGLRARPRTIRKTSMDGLTAFALDPLSDDEVRSGRVGAREVQISLQHR